LELTHSFTVPASRAQTWAAFEDIESVAGCFPGATVTEVSGDDFKGSCKVKLGPIALVYSGSGSFVSKDADAGTFLIEAKGKDKRGNGTAGAKVTATLTEAGPASTDVSVVTDLAITGKPAQFGRGVMQDVSDKLLQQFVTCLQSKVGDGGGASDDEAAEAGADVPGGDAGRPASAPEEAEQVAAAVTGQTPTGSPEAQDAASAPARSEISPVRSAPPGSDDALDLGATVLPVLARTYGRQAGIGAGLLLLGYLLGRRARR
jgi:carbon monoxide dehydrogenase subunit G